MIPFLEMTDYSALESFLDRFKVHCDWDLTF